MSVRGPMFSTSLTGGESEHVTHDHNLNSPYGCTPQRTPLISVEAYKVPIVSGRTKGRRSCKTLVQWVFWIKQETAIPESVFFHVCFSRADIHLLSFLTKELLRMPQAA